MFSCDFTFGIENYFSFSFRFGSSAVAKQEIKLVEVSFDISLDTDSNTLVVLTWPMFL